MQLGTVNTGVVHRISGLSREAVGSEDRQWLVKFLSHDLAICDGDQLTSLPEYKVTQVVEGGNHL